MWARLGLGAMERRKLPHRVVVPPQNGLQSRSIYDKPSEEVLGGPMESPEDPWGITGIPGAVPWGIVGESPGIQGHA